MKQLLMLVPLAVLALAAAAEAQSQAGGLPDVSARVKVLETQTKVLETRVTTLQTEAKALETRVNTLQSENETLKTALSKEQETRKAGDETLQTALSQEQETRKAGDETLQTALSQEQETRKAGDETVQTALSKETAERKTADTDLEGQVDVFGRVFTVSVPTTFLVNGGLRTVATLEAVPAGRYLVIAKANVENTIHDAGWHCFLVRNAEPFTDPLDFSEARTFSGSFTTARGHVSMVAVATLFEPGSFRMDCFTDENGSDIFTVKIVAVSVQ